MSVTKGTSPKRSVSDRQPHHGKWSRRVWERGWVGVPNMLLTSQRELDISTAQMSILLHLLAFWWGPKSEVFPSYAHLSKRIGISERQVARHIKALERKGYIELEHRTKAATKARTSNAYTFDGLVNKLKEIEKRLPRTNAKKKASS